MKSQCNLMFLDPGGGALDLKTTISISNGIPTLTVQISMKTDPYSALDKPQKHTLRGRTSGRSFTLSAPPLARKQGVVVV